MCSAAENVFLSSALFASFNGESLSRQGVCKPECIVVKLISVAATPVGAGKNTLGFPGLRDLETKIP